MDKYAVALLCAMAGVAGAAERSVSTPSGTYDAYQPYQEEALKPWREVNDEVARIGGHAGIFREQINKSPASPAPAVKPAFPASSPHGKHH
jgi:ABC-type taurine transport system ATPase subunit